MHNRDNTIIIQTIMPIMPFYDELKEKNTFCNGKTWQKASQILLLN